MASKKQGEFTDDELRKKADEMAKQPPRPTAAGMTFEIPTKEQARFQKLVTEHQLVRVNMGDLARNYSKQLEGLNKALDSAEDALKREVEVVKDELGIPKNANVSFDAEKLTITIVGMAPGGPSTITPPPEALAAMSKAQAAKAKK